MVKILYKPVFFRQCNKLPKALQEEIEEKIDLFEKDQKHPFLKVHKLKGRLRGAYSFSVNYEYRIVFDKKKENKVEFLLVGNHDIYK